MNFFEGCMLALVSVIGILMIIARKESLPDKVATSALTVSFYRMGAWLLRILERKARGRPGRTPVEENLRLLEPAADGKAGRRYHFIKKTGLSLLILMIGCFLSLLLSVKERGQGHLINTNELVREDGMGKSYQVQLDALMEGDTFEDIPIEVLTRTYTKDEITEMLPDFEQLLEMTVLSENDSADMVNRNLNFVENMEGYPFTIEWDTEPSGIIDRHGVLMEEISEEGSIVTLTATIQYQDFTEVYSFPIMAYPRERTAREQLLEDLKNAVTQQSAQSEKEEIFPLPESVDGVRIIWQEDKKHNAILLFLLIMVAGIAVFVGSDQELEKKVKRRNAEMLEDYPEVISKLTLLIGAGMTVRNAWKKIATDYLISKKQGMKSHFVYEEMLFTLYEMESGIGELQAYQHFATRSRVQRYVKMVSLLEQNVKMGARGFLEALQIEVQDALEDKKSNARKLGEEAGTKLLVPMIMMLFIVMAVILVPAFMTI